ncbi:MAG: hypothetical protein R2702_10055 [Acidimicrobiales bacterium]
MERSKPWQLEQALRTMQAFVALVHPEVNQSAWCQQEIGWALGRRVPHVLRVGVDQRASSGGTSGRASSTNPKRGAVGDLSR